MALEGAEALEDLEDLELLYDLGLRSLQLTWNFDNRYGASCMYQPSVHKTVGTVKLVLPPLFLSLSLRGYEQLLPPFKLS
jgi:membrane dipeptidase